MRAAVDTCPRAAELWLQGCCWFGVVLVKVPSSVLAGKLPSFYSSWESCSWQSSRDEQGASDRRTAPAWEHVFPCPRRPGPIRWPGPALTCRLAESSSDAIPVSLAMHPCLGPLLTSRVKYPVLCATHTHTHTHTHPHPPSLPFSEIGKYTHTHTDTLPFSEIGKFPASSAGSSQNHPNLGQLCAIHCSAGYLSNVYIAFLAFIVQSGLFIFCFGFCNFVAF